MSAVDPYEHDDAAYVLGLLDPAARTAFELHLAGCDACRASVDALTDTTALLAELEITDVDVLAASPEPVPDTSLPMLLRNAGMQRRRRHRVVGGLALAAAACLAALVVSVWPSADSGGRSQQLHALSSTPLTATATLTSSEHTTTISLRCHYAAVNSATYPAGQYQLVAVDRTGNRHNLGSWTVNTAGETTFASTVRLPISALKQVLVSPEGQRPVLSLNI